MYYSRPPGTVGQLQQSARRHSRPPGLQRYTRLCSPLNTTSSVCGQSIYVCQHCCENFYMHNMVKIQNCTNY
uniref:Uncharacterized protein n=1 Tax=Romanomermis culicivorax TaxID=13658 RepID=A0A915HX84_ROMCU